MNHPRASDLLDDFKRSYVVTDRLSTAGQDVIIVRLRYDSLRESPASTGHMKLLQARLDRTARGIEIVGLVLV